MSKKHCCAMNLQLMNIFNVNFSHPNFVINIWIFDILCCILYDNLKLLWLVEFHYYSPNTFAKVKLSPSSLREERFQCKHRGCTTVAAPRSECFKGRRHLFYEEKMSLNFCKGERERGFDPINGFSVVCPGIFWHQTSAID